MSLMKVLSAGFALSLLGLLGCAAGDFESEVGHGTQDEPIGERAWGLNEPSGCSIYIDFSSDAAGNPIAQYDLLDEQYAAWGIHFNNMFHVGMTSIDFPDCSEPVDWNGAPLPSTMLCTFMSSTDTGRCQGPIKGYNTELVLDLDFPVTSARIEGRTRGDGVYDADQMIFKAFDNDGNLIDEDIPNENNGPRPCNPCTPEEVISAEVSDAQGRIKKLTLHPSDIDALGPLVLQPVGCPIPSCQNPPPVAKCEDVETTDDGSCSATASIDAGSFHPDPNDTITCTQSPPGPYCTGTTTATLTCVDSHGATATCSATVTVIPNQPPVASCEDVEITDDDSCLGSVSIDAGSSDPDTNDTITCTQTPPGPYGLGTTAVTLTCTDNHGATASCSAAVTVVDQTVPPSQCSANVVAQAGPIELGQPVVASWTADAAHSPYDWIGLFKTCAPNNAPVLSQSVGSGSSGTRTFNLPLPPSLDPGPYEFRYFAYGGPTPCSTSNAFSGYANYALTGTPASVELGQSVTVTWQAPLGHSYYDWVGLYKVGSTTVLDSKSVQSLGIGSGTLKFILPLTPLLDPGPYEFRYFYYGRADAVAKSPSFAGYAKYALTGTPTAVELGQSLSVTWHAPLKHSYYDWVGLYKVGSTTVLDSKSVQSLGIGSRTLNFILPLTPLLDPGPYEFRYFYYGRADAVAKSCSFIGYAKYSLTGTPGSVELGQSVSVTWHAPLKHSYYDWVGLYKVGSTTVLDSKSVQSLGIASGTLNFILPLTPLLDPGPYEFRYFYYGRADPVAKSSSFIGYAHYTVTQQGLCKFGLPLTGAWTAPLAHHAYDWVGLFKAGAPDNSWLTYQHVYSIGLGSGTVSLTAVNAGVSTYELRYFVYGRATNVAVSGPFGCNPP